MKCEDSKGSDISKYKLKDVVETGYGKLLKEWRHYGHKTYDLFKKEQMIEDNLNTLFNDMLKVEVKLREEKELEIKLIQDKTKIVFHQLEKKETEILTLNVRDMNPLLQYETRLIHLYETELFNLFIRLKKNAVEISIQLEESTLSIPFSEGFEIDIIEENVSKLAKFVTNMEIEKKSRESQVNELKKCSNDLLDVLGMELETDGRENVLKIEGVLSKNYIAHLMKLNACLRKKIFEGEAERKFLIEKIQNLTASVGKPIVKFPHGISVKALKILRSKVQDLEYLHSVKIGKSIEKVSKKFDEIKNLLTYTTSFNSSVKSTYEEEKLRFLQQNKMKTKCEQQKTTNKPEIKQNVIKQKVKVLDSGSSQDEKAKCSGLIIKENLEQGIVGDGKKKFTFVLSKNRVPREPKHEASSNDADLTYAHVESGKSGKKQDFHLNFDLLGADDCDESIEIIDEQQSSTLKLNLRKHEF